MTAGDIIKALIDHFGKDCIWATELAFSQGRRRIDFWTMRAQLSKGYRATAYEIKISRADFKRDTHKKQREARLFSDQFYYVTPPALVKIEEIPDWAGLIEVHETGRVEIKLPATVRDKDMPSWELVISLIRNNGRVRRDEDVRFQQLAGLKRMVKEADKKLRAEGKEPWKYGIHT